MELRLHGVILFSELDFGGMCVSRAVYRLEPLLVVVEKEGWA